MEKTAKFGFGQVTNFLGKAFAKKSSTIARNMPMSTRKISAVKNVVKSKGAKSATENVTENVDEAFKFKRMNKKANPSTPSPTVEFSKTTVDPTPGLTAKRAAEKAKRRKNIVRSAKAFGLVGASGAIGAGAYGALNSSAGKSDDSLYNY